MSIKISIPARSFRDFYNEVMGRLRQVDRPEWFWFTGDNSQTDFALPAGWKPKAVFDAGALQDSGTGGDYSVLGPTAKVYTVSFGTAPALNSRIGVEAWRT